MRLVLPGVALIVALTPGCLGPAARWTRSRAATTTVILDVSESHPAVYVDTGPLDTALQHALDDASMVELREFLQTDGARKGNWPDTLWPSAPQRRWCRVARHPLLIGAAPHAEFFARRWSSSWSVGAAALAGRCYVLPTEFNQLLFDAGLAFEVEDIGTWARALALMVATYVDRVVVDPDSPDPLPAETLPDTVVLPELTFLKISAELERPRRKGFPEGGVTVVVDHRDTMELRFEIWGFHRESEAGLGLYPFDYDIWQRSAGTGSTGFLRCPTAPADP